MSRTSDRSTARRSRRAIAVALVGAVALLAGAGLVSCSGGGGDGAAPATTSGKAGPGTGDGGARPAGADDAWVMAYSAEEYGVEELIVATSTDGATWKDVGHSPALTSLAAGPDGWVGIGFQGAVFASADLRTWKQVATVGTGLTLRGLAYGGGRFVAVGATSPPDGPAVPRAFWSADGTTWTQATVPAVDIPDPTSAATDDVDLPAVAFSDGDGFVAHAVLSAAEGSGGQVVTLVSSDGASWKVVGEPLAGNGATAAGGGRIVSGFTTDRLSADRRLRIGGVGLQASPDAAFEPVAGSPFEQQPISELAHGDGRFLALAAESFNEGTGSGDYHAYSSTDGRTWKEVGSFDGYPSALAYGDVGGTASATTTATTTEGTDLHAVDWHNRAYEVCDEKPTLVDGHWQDAGNAVLITLDQVQYGDADGDGTGDAVLTFSCAPIGGNANPRVVNLVFTPGDGAPRQLGAEFEGNQATLVDGGIRTVDPVWDDDDPHCCPSGTRTTLWHFQGGTWVGTVVAGDPTTTTAPPATAPPTTRVGSGPSGALPAMHGYGLVGSGCTPGPGALPDGWWFGSAAATPRPGGSFGFDLACYSFEKMADQEHGHDDVVVTNQNKALRTVPVAGDATLSCSTIVNGGEEPCHGYADPAVWVRIQGGVATKVVTQLWWE